MSETKKDYKINDVVYVKANDCNKLLKGKVIGFTKVGEIKPIIEAEHPYKKGETFQNAFDFESISDKPILKKLEWSIIEKIYKYEN
jgi:hypothetical protein